MRVLSLFSGVGGFDMGLEAAGMTTVFQCEIDKHARSVLDHHWPDVPKWGDVTTLTGAHILEQTGGVDVVAWGSPCQDLSLAGKRAGLSGERSGLFHEGIRIIKELRELSNGKYPTWSIWENVVGALSSNRGADFGEVLYEMDEAGACFSEWAVLDAQYFGVPQRRRRVFVTSCFDSATSERCGSPLFPVSESLRGDSSTGIKTGEATPGSVAESTRAGGYVDSNGILRGTVTSKWAKGSGTAIVEPVHVDGSDVSPTLRGFGHGWQGQQNSTHGVIQPVLAFDTQFGSNANVFEDQSPTLKASQQSPSVTQNADSPMLLDGRRVDDVRVYTEPVQTLQERMGTGGNNVPVVGQETQALSYDGYNQTVEEEIHRPWRIGRDSSDFIADLREPTLIVRRLTPLECTRLMGWRDDHLEIGTLDAKDQDYARQVVRHLWRNLQPETVQRHTRGFWSVLTPEVLLSAVRLGWISWDMAGKCAASAREIQGENAWPENFMRRLWAYQEFRPSPYRREPFEQLAKELGRPLSFLPSEETQETTGLFYLRVYESAQGTGFLQQALDSLEKMGRPFVYQEQVANISDTQRYKMCGNGVASPVATWIGKHLPTPNLNG